MIISNMTLVRHEHWVWYGIRLVQQNWRHIGNALKTPEFIYRIELIVTSPPLVCSLHIWLGLNVVTVKFMSYLKSKSYKISGLIYHMIFRVKTFL